MQTRAGKRKAVGPPPVNGPSSTEAKASSSKSSGCVALNEDADEFFSMSDSDADGGKGSMNNKHPNRVSDVHEGETSQGDEVKSLQARQKPSSRPRGWYATMPHYVAERGKRFGFPNPSWGQDNSWQNLTWTSEVRYSKYVFSS